MPTVRTRISLDAPLSRVWLFLTDFSRWGAWNDVITQVVGVARVGESISFKIHVGVARLPIHAKIVAAEPERSLAWRGGPRGIFQGEHAFHLREEGGLVELVHEEYFRGRLADWCIPMLTSQIESSYRHFNESLAKAVRSS